MKNNRQSKILELINENIILTQEDLQESLQSLGFKVTQSTISRDIKELRLVKGHDSDGNYRYVSSDIGMNNEQPLGHYRDLFARSVKSVDYALNNIVIKCFNGMASSAGVVIDSLYGTRMLGSLAGDDTVLIVTRSEAEAQTLANELKKLI